MKKIVTLFITVVFASIQLVAQMNIGGFIKYGNEWIDYSKTYHKIKITEDGVYKVPVSSISSALVGEDGSELQLFRNGEEIPLHVSTPTTLSANDYIEFYGVRNRGEIDKYLYDEDSNDQLNPYHSFFSDTSTYFLTTSSTAVQLEGTANDLTNLPTKESYFFDEQIIATEDPGFFAQPSYGQFFLKESTFIEGVTNMAARRDWGFDEKEFYFNTPSLYKATNLNCSLATGFIVNNGGVRLTETMNDETIFSNPNISAESERFVKNVHTFSNQTLENGSNTYTINANFLSGSSNAAIAGASHSLTYPSTFDFENLSLKTFTIEGKSNEVYLEISNFNHNGTAPILLDLTNNLRIVTSLSGEIIRVKLPVSINDRKLVLYNENAVKNINYTIQTKQFTNFNITSNQGDYIIISNPEIYDKPGEIDQVSEYLEYRKNNGGYTPILITTEELYDQFSYGIAHHGMAFKNLAQYGILNWSITPTHLFVIGKGRTHTGDRIKQYQYITTTSLPESDNLLTALPGNSTPALATGRIPAINNAEIKIYLDKVKEYEGNPSLPATIEDRAWMKNIMHLSGGGVNEQRTIKTFMDQYAEIATDNQYGANVISYYKTSSDAIQQSESQELIDQINEGVSLISFYGHSSTNSWDFSIDNVETWENFNGKYPIISSLGCYSGIIHDVERSISEDFVFAEGKGAIAYLASTDLATISGLNVFTRSFYNQFSGDAYGLSLGEAIRLAIEENESNNSVFSHMIFQQITLNGDPGIQLNSHSFPDYIPDETSLVTPSTISTTADNFNIQFDVFNIGFSLEDSINISIIQTYENGVEELVAQKRILAPKYKDSYTFDIPIDKSNSAGQNTFSINIDSEQEISEASESNNILIFEKFIFSEDITPITPTEFSIINQATTLIASSSNLSSRQSNYYFQIDTVSDFSSPLLDEMIVSSQGGIIEATPGITFQDSTIYYWRVRPDSALTGGTLNWNNSSFTYNTNSSIGWNQEHYQQFSQNDYTNLYMDVTQDRKLKFVGGIQDYRVRTSFSDVYPNAIIEYTLNNTQQHEFRDCSKMRNGLYVIWVDGTTGQPYTNTYQSSPTNNGEYGSEHCRGGVYRLFPFDTRTESQRVEVVNFLQNVVPNGDYVILFSLNDMRADEWADDNGTTLMDVLVGTGLPKIINTASTLAPYAGIYRKGDATFAPYDFFGTNENSILSESFPVPVPAAFDEGSMTSTPIGPSTSWSSLEFVTKTDNPSETFSFDIYGIDENGNTTTNPLKSNITTSGVDLSDIDPVNYPYLSLTFNTHDPQVPATATCLEYWRVLYDGVSEFAVAPKEFFSFKADTIQEGETIELEIAVKNIGFSDSDSLLVEFTLNDSQNKQLTVLKRFAPIAKDEFGIIDIILDSEGFTGNSVLSMVINPNNDQPETNLSNNYYQKDFHILEDTRNPLLDVTVDGITIHDGASVYFEPEIVATLRDENQFLLLDDPSVFTMSLAYRLNDGDSLATGIFPDEYETIITEGQWLTRVISSDDSDVTFSPAEEGSGSNSITLRLNPEGLIPGEYELIVYATDESGNSSGKNDYRVRFVVGETESKISNFFNYPNPFSTSTRFVYTMDGTQIPDDVKIQILSVSGKIVKTITSDELGPLEVGTNETDFAWDGTDDYGDKLANGVYLYRVVTSVEGRILENIALGEENGNADDFVEKGFNKLVILR